MGEDRSRSEEQSTEEILGGIAVTNEMFDVWGIYFLGYCDGKSKPDILKEIKEYLTKTDGKIHSYLQLLDTIEEEKRGYVQLMEKFALIGMAALANEIQNRLAKGRK